MHIDCHVQYIMKVCFPFYVLLNDFHYFHDSFSSSKRGGTIFSVKMKLLFLIQSMELYEHVRSLGVEDRNLFSYRNYGTALLKLRTMCS